MEFDEIDDGIRDGMEMKMVMVFVMEIRDGMEMKIRDEIDDGNGDGIGDENSDGNWYWKW